MEAVRGMVWIFSGIAHFPPPPYISFSSGINPVALWSTLPPV